MSEENKERKSHEKKAKKISKRKNIAKPNIEGKNISEILGISKDYLQNKKSKNSIEQLNIERILVDNIIDSSSVLKNIVKSGDDLIKTYPELNYDIFLALYKGYPKLVEKEDINENYLLNHGLVDELTDLDQFDNLRKYCMMDEFSSAVASISMHENAQKKITQIIEKYKEEGKPSLIDEINEAISKDEELQKLINQAEAIQDLQSKVNDNEKLNEASDYVRMKLEDALKIAEKQQETLLDNMELKKKELKEIKSAFKNSISPAFAEVKESLDTVEAWGFSPGEAVRVPFDSKIAAIKRIKKSKKLKQFTDIIGKLKEMAKQEQKIKSIHGVSDIVDVSIGSTLQHILPSELMLMNNNITKLDFYKRYFSNNLLQYELNNYDRRGRGPIIVCVDISGSMDGEREIFSKAFAVALIDIAQLQKRNFAYISFDTNVCKEIIIEKGYLDPQMVVDICEEGTRGGTDFHPPIKRALALLLDSRFKKGDIVFVTDGECSLSDSMVKKFNNIKKEKEFCCRGVLINTGRDVSRSSLDLFCDDVVSISDIAGLSSESVIAKKIFRDL